MSNNRIQTIAEVESDFSDQTIPAGTTGIIVECYDNPEGYAADLAIPDKSLSGEFRYENVILAPEQFVVIRDIQRREKMDAAVLTTVLS